PPMRSKNVPKHLLPLHLGPYACTVPAHRGTHSSSIGHCSQKYSANAYRSPCAIVGPPHWNRPPLRAPKSPCPYQSSPSIRLRWSPQRNRASRSGQLLQYQRENFSIIVYHPWYDKPPDEIVWHRFPPLPA